VAEQGGTRAEKDGVAWGVVLAWVWVGEEVRLGLGVEKVMEDERRRR
jgi:hypothetical protein